MLMEKTVVHYAGITFKKKGSSLLMKIFAILLMPFSPHFMTSYWTTIFTTIYVPDFTVFDDKFYEQYKTIIVHERRHILDFKKYHILFILSYLFPPAFLAYGRFVWERRAYLDELDVVALQFPAHSREKQLRDQIDGIAEVLSSAGYLWCWPKKWIRRWFLAQYRIPV